MSFFLQPTNWVFLSFLIFAGLFVRFGWSRVTAMLDARIAAIRAELEAAEKLRLEAADLLAQYQTRHREAMREAQEIKHRAHLQAESIREHAEDELRETIARRERQLEDRLERIEQAAVDELRAATASLAVKAAESLVRQNLDAKGQAALVDKSVSAIAAL